MGEQHNGEAAKGRATAASEKKAKKKRRKRRFMRQRVMRRMCYALLPILAAGIYFFGWRVLLLTVVVTAFGLLTEWRMASRRGKPISEACFVTCLLYALSLPPTMPLWMAGVGIFVGILFGKEVYGGFGRNWCNPAIVGRAFVYVAFPRDMTGSFVPVFRGFPGGLTKWSFASLGQVPGYLSGAAETVTDAVTAATPMWARRDFDYVTPLHDLFFGNIGDTFPTEFGTQRALAAGSIGETCAPLIVLAAVYLLWTKTANWRLMLGPFIGGAAAVALFRHLGGFDGVPPIPFTFCAGAFLYGAVYMVTEPISAPKKKPAIWVYSIVIGFLIVLLRWKSQFSGAVAFSILMGNTLAPSLDMAVDAWKEHQKARAEGAEDEAAGDQSGEPAGEEA